MDVFLSASEREMCARNQKNAPRHGFCNFCSQALLPITGPLEWGDISDVGFDVVGGSCETRRKYTWWTEPSLQSKFTTRYNCVRGASTGQEATPLLRPLTTRSAATFILENATFS